MLSVPLPLMDRAFGALGSRTKRQAPVEPAAATARADATGEDDMNMPENHICNGWLITTSMAPLSPAWLPDSGGLLTVTAVPPCPSTKPSCADTPFASVVRSPPALRAIAAEYAARSAAPCIADLVTCQDAASVARPANPISTVNANPVITAAAPRV